jgi:hypothetical protein
MQAPEVLLQIKKVLSLSADPSAASKVLHVSRQMRRKLHLLAYLSGTTQTGLHCSKVMMTSSDARELSMELPGRGIDWVVSKQRMS